MKLERKQFARWTLTAGVALISASALVLAGCGGKKKDATSQVAAKVNKEEISVHQINFVLSQQRGLRQDQTDAASRQILERLIDQELAVQKAGDLKVDRDPRVVQAIEAARREVIARAYMEKVSEGAAKPAPEEIKKYYDEHPALFKERRIYNIQEIAIETTPDQVDGLRAALQNSKNVGEFLDGLKAKGVKFGVNQAVRAAEQIPLPGLEKFAQMKDGQAVLNPAPNGALVIVLAGSRSEPVTEEQARPAIEQFLINERKRELVSKELKNLRASAQVQYVGKFADKPAAGTESAAASAVEPASTPAPAAAPAPAPAPASASSMDASTINKGLGIK